MKRTPQRTQKPNELFHYIKFKEEGLFKSKTAHSGERFMFYQLPNLPKGHRLFFSCSLLPEVWVIEHHISIFESLEQKNDRSSQYHYTATLADKFHEYTLHVYFDKMDIQCCTLLSCGDRHIKIEHLPEFTQRAAALAFNHTINVFNKLRLQQQNDFMQQQKLFSFELLKLESLGVIDSESSQKAWLKQAEQDVLALKQAFTESQQYVTNADGQLETWEAQMTKEEFNEKVEKEFKKFKKEFLKNI